MEILGTIIKRAFQLRKTINKVRRTPTSAEMQRKTLLKLVKRAKNTSFGYCYDFETLLTDPFPEKTFQERVPIHDYDKIYSEWWNRTLDGEENICWPGKVNYFALSSGTSGSASKYIPITNSVIKSMRKTSVRQILSLINYNIPEELFAKGVLVVGGSTDLQKMGNYWQGDLSGINQKKMPFYTRPFNKPGKKIAKHRDWNKKIQEIVDNAPKWDIVVITGIPAWNQLIIENIIEKYKLKNIHEMWPNLSVFIYGGVAFEPYRKKFEQMMGKPIHYVETYLASEGFIAYQSRADVKGMELVLNNGIFIEFIPFNSDNFTADGSLKADAKALLIDEVEEGVEYAILLSTNAGAWRYLIGDTVKFTSLENREIIITGRTKHFLSLCGEHLSTDNMNRAIELVNEKMGTSIREYTVLPIITDTHYGHRWYVGLDEKTDLKSLQTDLDGFLKELNDDYAVERMHALTEIQVISLPTQVFYQWMESKGKMGGQHKFPRVLKNELAEDWEGFLLETAAIKP